MPNDNGDASTMNDIELKFDENGRANVWSLETGDRCFFYGEATVYGCNGFKSEVDLVSWELEPPDGHLAIGDAVTIVERELERFPN